MNNATESAFCHVLNGGRLLKIHFRLRLKNSVILKTISPHKCCHRVGLRLNTIVRNYCLALFAVSEIFVSCSAQGDPHDKPTSSMKNLYYSRTDTHELNVANDEWKTILPENLYLVSREQHTERAFTGEMWRFEGRGHYYCAVCGNHLFDSDAKFVSSCGWPSFFAPAREQAMKYKPDNTHGMRRTEVTCGRCNSHLGHIFDDGPPPTNKRYCMNAVSLDFEPEASGSE
jgi:peptide-methionine (R)-S-oxide reductase